MIDILLATYNGAAFLPAQLASLVAQSATGWRLIAHDDGSTDDTARLLSEFAARHARHALLLESAERLGVIGNFSALLAASDAPYALFCDQDDVWHADKIVRSLEAMQTLERAHGAGMPLLVHGDARVVDEALRPIAASFHAMQKLNPARVGLRTLLVQNVAHGCTLLMNRALVRLATPIPPQARMHDHWVALVAAAQGHIAYVDAPLLEYRQHSANAVGARGSSVRSVRAAMRQNRTQAAALRERIGTHGNIEHFLRLSALPWPLRGPALLAAGYTRAPWYQNLPVWLLG